MHFVLLVVLFALSIAQSPVLDHYCSADHLRRFVDVSTARIQKSKTYQYDLVLHDTPVSIIKNGSQVSFRGNFATLTLRNNNLRKEHVYKGTELLIKIPTDHVFSLKKPADLQIQILFQGQQITKENVFHFIMLSQLYVISKLKQNIQTILSKYFSPQTQEGDLIQTSKIVKLLQGFPMLMYRGSGQNFPCKNNLLCFLKRQYQLISENDFEEIKSFVNQQNHIEDRKAFKTKNLYEVSAIIKEKTQKNIKKEEQLQAKTQKIKGEEL